MIYKIPYLQLLGAAVLLSGVTLMTGCSSPDKVTRTTTTEHTAIEPAAPVSSATTTTTTRETQP